MRRRCCTLLACFGPHPFLVETKKYIYSELSHHKLHLRSSLGVYTPHYYHRQYYSHHHYAHCHNKNPLLIAYGTGMFQIHPERVQQTVGTMRVRGRTGIRRGQLWRGGRFRSQRCKVNVWWEWAGKFTSRCQSDWTYLGVVLCRWFQVFHHTSRFRTFINLPKKIVNI